MILLTDQEIFNLDPSPSAGSDEHCLSFARAIEAAVTKKLATGSVEQKPYGEIVTGKGPAFAAYRLEDRPVRLGQQFYTRDQLTTAIAAARVQALEEAAHISYKSPGSYGLSRRSATSSAIWSLRPPA